MTTFTTASAAGAPLAAPTADWLLSFPATAANQGFVVKPGDASGSITSFTLIYDLYFPSAGTGDWLSFLQIDPANTSDGDLFGSVSDGAYGIGISSQYQGTAELDAWHRVAFTFEAGVDGTTLNKYIDGTLVGTQQVDTDRFTINTQTGFSILADNDGETAAGHLGSFLFSDFAMSQSDIAGLGGPRAGGILSGAPATGHAVQFDFTNGVLTPSIGTGTIEPVNVTPVVETPVEADVPALPDANDSGVLAVPASPGGQGGFLVDPGIAGPAASFTMVFDVFVKAADIGGYSAMFQTDLTNTGDADFFMRLGDGGTYEIGISSNYDGAATLDAWHRIAVTVDANGDGTSAMKKYIDGTLVDTQTVDTARFTLSDNGFLIFADEDGESAPSHLNSFLVTDEVMSEAEIAALGGTDPDGILSEAPATGNATQFDFDDGSFTPTFGSGTMVDKTPVIEEPTEEGPQKIAPIKDMMVTPDAENVTIDLASVFSGEGLTYTLQVAEETVVDPTIVDGKLVLDFGELGFSDIKVTATDAEGHSTSDVFRVRVAGENAYTIASFPDTQNYTSNPALNHIFGDMTQWLVDNKEAHNIQFMVHVGDITENNLSYQWDIAEEALRKLDGKIPYSLLPGNHDQANGGTAQDHTSVYLDERFSPDKQEEVAPGNFGGVFDQETNSSRNSYSTFTAPDGTKWLVLSMEFGPRDDVIRWAADVIEGHLDHRVIIASHALTDYAGRHDPLGAPLYDEGAGYDYGIGLDPEGANDGETVFRELIAKYPNVAMTFSGHIFGDGAETNVSYSQYGNPTFEFLVNYQNGVSREITGNGDEALGNRGGNGAIRLVVVDPDNNTVSTETYFTEFDDYLDGYRVKPELDRDGLTGEYRGHQETFTDIDLGTPELYAMAKAGDDLYVEAEEGASTATVTLNAAASLNPKGQALTYSWTDEDGDVIASGTSPALTADLGLGKHELTLTVTDADGVKTTDDVVVIVSGDETLLVETFNDGNADGWSVGYAVNPEIQFGTAASFGIPALGSDDTIAFLPALSNGEKLVVLPVPGAPSGSIISSYTLMFDIYVLGENATEYTALFQVDPTNKSDGELFIQMRDDGTGVLETGGGRHGVFEFDAWQRVAAVVELLDDGSAKLTKYINGVKVGEQAVDPARFSFDAADGLMVFTDNDGENTDMYVSSVLVSDKVYTEAEIAALGGPAAGGILTEQPTPYTSQFNFDSEELDPAFGPAGMGFGGGSGEIGSFLLKGSVFTRSEAETAAGIDAPEAALWEQTDGADKTLLWTGEGSAAWSNYVYEASLTSLDNDGIGAVFYYQDFANYYLFKMDGETNSRQLIKVQDGVQTVMAEVAMGYQYNTDMKLKIAVVDGEINVFLNDRNVFDGPVVDTDPLTHGTVGVYSSGQRSSMFDDIAVTRVGLTAHAGEDLRVLDFDGDGKVAVSLDADSSFGLADIVSYVWTDKDGTVVATGKYPVAELSTGINKLTLTVTDSTGKTATDNVDVTVVAKSKILVSDDFSSPASLDKWTIVDEGEFGGVGADGKSSDWQIQDGKLVQTTDLQSRELTWEGATDPDYWQRGWSPLGDGVNVLRLGTYALYNDPEALNWDDYAVEATFQTPDDDGLGFLFHYTDAHNYYKIELDAEGTFDRSPSNGAGSIFNLIRMRNGVEEILGQVPGKYEQGEAMTLRVEIVGNSIQAYLNDEPLFAYSIEDHGNEKGTFGLYSWGNEGLSFDNVTVVDLTGGLDTVEETNGTTGDDVLEGTDGDDTIHGLAGDDIISAGKGLDKVYGDEGGDVLLGGEGDDLLDGGAGDDVIIGNEGDDDIAGGTGADLIEGGKDDDYLAGGDGSDTYVYAAGDGSDTIAEGAGQTGDQDRLMLDDVARGEAVFHRHGTDVVIKIGGETVTLKNQLAGGGVEVVTFENGTVLTRSDIANAVVNRGPVATADTLANIAEDAAAITIPLASLLANDTDADLDTLTISGVSAPVGGTVEIVDGAIRFTPAANFNGTASFTYAISDAHGGTASATASFAVTAVNDVPVIAASATVAGPEDQVLTGQFIASDADGDALTYAVKEGSGAANGTVSLDAVTGAWTYTPAANFHGADQFTVKISDGHGGFTETLVSVDIASVNDGPVAVADTLAPVAEDAAAITITFASLLANDTDADLDTLTISGVSAPVGGTVEIVDGAIRFTPAANFNGTASFTYDIADGNGGTASAIASFDVTSVNDAPVISAPTVATGTEDQVVTGQIVASDTDGGTLAYSVKQGSGAANGTVSLNAATGAWTYTPVANFNGADHFTVQVADGQGGFAETVVSVNLAAVNDAPVAVDDTGTADESEARIFDLAGNDTDVDGAGPTLMGFTVTGVNGIALSAQAAQAAFSIVDGKLAFTPGSLFEGLDEGDNATVTLGYTVQDAGGLTDTGSFTLTVSGESDLNLITGTNGTNILIGTNQGDAVLANGGSDYVFGRNGGDLIDAGNGNDYVFGGGGHDIINGGAGRDTLFGEDGNDVLIGDAGNDRLSGGSGSDTFVFREGFGSDTVLDFSAQDVIELSTADFADFADLQAHLSNTSSGAQITADDGSTLTLLGVNKSSLHQDDFHFVA